MNQRSAFRLFGLISIAGFCGVALLGYAGRYSALLNQAGAQTYTLTLSNSNGKITGSYLSAAATNTTSRTTSNNEIDISYYRCMNLASRYAQMEKSGSYFTNVTAIDGMTSITVTGASTSTGMPLLSWGDTASCSTGSQTLSSVGTNNVDASQTVAVTGSYFKLAAGTNAFYCTSMAVTYTCTGGGVVSSSSSSYSSSSSVPSSSSSSNSSSNSTSDPNAAYYASIDWSQEGSVLRTSLMNLLVGKQTKATSYTYLNTLLLQTDLDPAGSGKLLGFYDETPLNPVWDSGVTWNKEHVWPNSRGAGETGPGSDPHMIRAAAKSTNSSRGNSMYAESGAYDPGAGTNMPKYRGIAARIIFYTATHWWTSPGVNSNNLELTETVSDDSSNNTMGKLSDLLKWNLEYGIDAVETHRNSVIVGYNNVRNPFIDHPEAACKIWGNTDAETQAVCSIA